MAENPHKVMLLIPNLQQGGAEKQILELARNLPARFAPVLCLWNDKIHYRDLLPAGQPRHVLGVQRLGRKGLRRLQDVLREEKPSILHSYRDKANFLARLALPRAPVPVVLTSVRNRAINLLYLLTERYLSRRSDRVLVNSQAVRYELRRWARVPDSKIQIIHNFIDLERFHPPSAEERAAARARFNLASDELALLLPGRVSLQKNHMRLVRALAWLRRRGRLPGKVRVLLAGRERDPFYAAWTWRLAALLGVEQNLVRLGVVTDMPTLYHAADVLLLPSLWEGLPNAANVDRIVLPGESGLEVPTLGIRSLAEALSLLIESPAEQLRRMGERGRAHVAASFGPQRVLAETVALYDALLAEKGLS